MTDRLLVDLEEDGSVAVGVWRDGELPGALVARPGFAWPLSDAALGDLRWYLEDYLVAPFGVYQERGPEIEARLGDWGEQIFDALFGSGAARDAYVELQARGGPVELVVRSSSPQLLGLPWELLRDPRRPTPLALDTVGVTRSLASGFGDTFTVSGDRLRVLMVISRPSGTDDIGYRMIARPLLERLEAVRGDVELVVLRPPTLANLAAALSEAHDAGRPFQLVHFDGHGALAGARTGVAAGAPDRYATAATEATLAFERETGGADLVPASRVALVLRQAKVPLVVLNACQSGAVGKALEAAVATRLLQEGVGSVVAMAYSVYAVAAAEFMAAFYERLFAGDSVGAAVGAGRARLHQRPLRPSPKGDIPLADWVVPVHYMRRAVSFRYLRTDRPVEQAPIDQMLDERRARSDADLDPLAPAETFVGRDGLFFELETAARLQRVVVLHGSGGTGKTELAKAFGRWWRDTGGVERPEWVLVHSFEPGLPSFGLDGVVTEVGMEVLGARFAQLDRAQRRATVLQLLRERRLLLIWDNFESVLTMPDPSGATPPLGPAQQDEMREFLLAVAREGRSAVLITSRSDEAWLGDVRRIALDGLTRHETIEYADQLLAPFPRAAPRRQQRAFDDLLAWLDGHPLAMRLVLPHLETTEPRALLDGLRGSGELPEDVDAGDGRTRSLAASIAYSFDHLDERARGLLVAASLFQGIVQAELLATFSITPDVPQRFSVVTLEDWSALLDAAAGVGLLMHVAGGVFRMHPALPRFLAARWHDAPGGAAERERAGDAFVAACAALGRELNSHLKLPDAPLALAYLRLHRHTLGRQLSRALADRRWAEARDILDPLTQQFDGSGRVTEARMWVDRVRAATEAPDGAPPALGSRAGELWIYAVGGEANRAQRLGDHAGAEATHREILRLLEAQPEASRDDGLISIAMHQIGICAQARGDLAAAEDWCRRSLAIDLRRGDERGAAHCYHQLGMLVHRRGDLPAAEDWFRRSLAIASRHDDQAGIAIGSHHLGVVAVARGEVDAAEDLFTRALALNQQLGNEYLIASNHHQLSIVAEMRDDYPAAEAWSIRSLAIEERLEDQPGIARSYTQLGRIASRQGDLDTAERWYGRALALLRPLGDRRAISRLHAALALVAQRRGDRDAELPQWVAAAAAADGVEEPMTLAIVAGLLDAAAHDGEAALETTWAAVNGAPLPAELRDGLRARLREGDGESTATAIARASALRLAGEHGPGLEADVEAALLARDGTTTPAARYADPVSVASLIVSVATLAWQVHADVRRRSGSAPRAEVVERRVRLELAERSAAGDDAHRDRVIAVVVSELVERAEQRPDRGEAGPRA